jgi:hypothetical protein
MLKKLLILMLVFVVLFTALGFVLPTTWHVERSMVIAAEPAEIHAQIESLKGWPEWTAWTRERDASLAWEFEGPEAGVGAVMKWQGDPKIMGDGVLTVTRSDPAEGLDYDMSMMGGSALARGGLRYERVEEGTRVTWTDDGDMGLGPVAGWLTLLFSASVEEMVASDFTTGLENLKLRLEGPPAVEGAEGSEVDQAAAGAGGDPAGSGQ